MSRAESGPLEEPGNLPYAMTDEQVEFWKKLMPVNRVASTDTYKRTMGASGDTFNNYSSYSLMARKPLKEEGANGRLIMAGLERMLYPWFGTKISESEIRKAEEILTKHSEIDKFPRKAWDLVIENKGFLPIDIYGFPGGQTFLVKKQDGSNVPMHVPILSVEGPGALVSHIEPHMVQGYAPIIYATKARLMREVVGEKHAEFGFRSARNNTDHGVAMMAIKVGANYYYTSNDEIVYLFPNEFTSIGTIGHEYSMAYQREGISLEEAQDESLEDFIEANKKAAVLPDIIDTNKSGLPAIRRLRKKYKGTNKVIIPRLDSGPQIEQLLNWKRMTLEDGDEKISVIVEDGYTPTKARIVKAAYKKASYDPNEIIVGSGGYFQNGNLRDAISFAYKRSSTEHNGILEPNIKFSDTPGKLSLPGPIRVYEKGKDGNILLVALKGEDVGEEPLYFHLVENGRIKYKETLAQQAKRADETWNKYDRIEYSSGIKAIIKQRTKERDEIKRRL